jgi:hypothetical protein
MKTIKQGDSWSQNLIVILARAISGVGRQKGEP